jgi:hypothetical protein
LSGEKQKSMKIVQTLWLPTSIQESIKHTAGWLSAEYHWIAWALSCILLKKQYPAVELYTTKAGKEVLIDQLELPYSTFHIIPKENLINSENWALSKLITYGLQNKAFLHIDGDVFVWKPFKQDLLNSALIAQNAETDRDAYEYELRALRREVSSEEFDFTLPKTGSVIAYNAGIIGGHDLEFFAMYTSQAIALAQLHLISAPTDIDPMKYCMIFEQYFFAQMSKKHERKVTTLFKTPVSDIGYPGFNNFQVMKKKGYWHLMGHFKKNRYNLKMMVSELRHLDPYLYYKILKLCKAATVSLDFKVYDLPELDPLSHNTEYYLSLIKHYEYNYKFSEIIDWKHYYAKDFITFIQLKGLLEKERSYIVNKLQFTVCYDFSLTEETMPILKQVIKFPDTCTLQMISIELDGVNMILLDAIHEGSKTVQELTNVLLPYYGEENFSQNKKLLIKIINDRMYDFVYWGIVRWEVIT